MTSIIKLTPISGAHDESQLCYVLQVDEFRFLLDCGWDEKLSSSYMDDLKKVIHQIDAVLISYPDVYHIGALPYLVGRCGLQCPIYATIPVYKMGQMFMYDLYQSHHNSEEFTVFSLDDVDNSFEKVTQLKYSQSVTLKGKGKGLTITPLPAGHMIGGTIWKILKDGEEEIIYAVDYNHKKERHLNGCALESVSRPNILITDSFNAKYAQTRRRQRDEQLMTIIMNTLRNNGNVLVTVDTAGRVLELSHLLDQLWRTEESGLAAFSLALLNNVSYNVVEFAKSQVEWMSDKIMRLFEDNRNNPFQFKHLVLCHTLGELAKVPEPKVVLVSQPDLDCGYSRDLFIDWCGNPSNSVILTCRTTPGTLARMLIDNQNCGVIKLEVRKRVRLDGDELEEYLEKQKVIADEISESKTNGVDEGVGSESSESETEMDIETVPTGLIPQHDLLVDSQPKRKSGFFGKMKKSYPMFPFVEEKLKWDDLGEVIRPEDYMTDLITMDDDKVKLEKVIDEEYEENPNIPTKCISSTDNIDIRCSVTYIDFEGRSDGESIKKLISLMKPRQLILVHGTSESTQYLAEYCQSIGIAPENIYTPKRQEVVDATIVSHIYQVRLTDSLFSKLQFTKAKDYDLTWVDVEVSMETERKDLGWEGKLAADDQSMDTVPTLDTVTSTDQPGHTTVFINDPRLTEFKMVLIKAGIQAEFSGGVLYCNNVIAVKKNEAGNFFLEGCLCDDYYTVRDLLYEQFAIL